MRDVFIPSGQDPMDYDEDTAASRVGRRLKNIRKARKMTQAELGEPLQLSGDRIQKYENGARKPRLNVLKALADELEVSTLAISDPNTTTFIGTMYAFFEMEELFDLNLEFINGRYALTFGDGKSGTLNNYLKEWNNVRTQFAADLQKVTSDNEREAITNEYNEWKWTFPSSIGMHSPKQAKERQIMNQMAELQKQLDELKKQEN